ncbi:MAG: glycosyltransferase family 39 protein [Candidatus Gygaella obscura]|nr:glycosyltransferase family 39 protein [Candidatus Gygaella obscura]
MDSILEIKTDSSRVFLYRRNVFLPILFVFLIVVLHAAVNYFILVRSRFCLLGDSAFHYSESFVFFNQLKQFFKAGDFIDFFRDYTAIGSNYRTPFLMLATIPFYFIFGVSQTTAIMSNMLFFLVLVSSVYGIARILYNQKTAILASLIVSVLPGIFSQSRIFLQDLALSAMVALSFYLLIKSDNFKNFRISLIFGVIFGLGLLTKWSYPIFMILPMLFMVDWRRVVVKNLFLGLSIGLLIASSWYIPNLSNIILRLPKSAFSILNVNNDRWYYYLETLYDYQLLPVYFALLISGITFLVLKKEFIFPLFVIFPIVLFSFSHNKDARFILPVFFVIAIIIARFIVWFDREQILVKIIIIFSLVQFIAICFFPTKTPWIKKIINVNRVYPDNMQGLYFATDRGDWKTTQIFETLSVHLSDDADKKYQVLSIPALPGLHSPLIIASAKEALSVEFICPAEFDQSLIDQEIDFDKIIHDSDFVITKTGYMGISFIKGFLNETNKAFLRHKHEFIVLKTFSLEHVPGSDIDDSVVYLYKRIDKN